MYRGMRVAAVLPAYNEDRYIAAAVRIVPRDLVDDVIVIDDHSTDRTAAEAQSAGADLVVTLEENRGVGYAIKSGWRRALERGADFAVVIPGDGQADVAALADMLARSVAGYDLVIGDRISGRDPTRQGMPIIRLLGSRGLAILTWMATGVYVPDPQSGYQVVSARLLRTVRLDELADRWGTHNDLISHCALAGLRVTTVGVAPIYFTATGERVASHWRMGDVVRRNLAVLRKAFRRRMAQWLGRRTYPRGPGELAAASLPGGRSST